MPFGIGFFAAAGAGGAGATYEQIESVILTGSQTSISFSAIPTTFSHLQLRIVARGGRTDYVQDEMYLRINGATNGYARHYIRNSGASIVSQAATDQDSILIGWIDSVNAPANHFGAIVCDILDAQNTNKNKTIRSLGGHRNATDRMVALASGFRANTAAVTSLTILGTNGFASGSRFSLYGIRG